MSHWGGIKRDKYDKLFSKLVRERANWKCEYAGRQYCSFGQRDFSLDSDSMKVLHNSHLFGRRSTGTRLHPDNGFSHCHQCHQYLGEHPAYFARWAEEKLGKEKYERLLLLANKPTKMSKFDKEIIHKHYLAEMKRIKALRMDGETGRLEFYLP